MMGLSFKDLPTIKQIWAVVASVVAVLVVITQGQAGIAATEWAFPAWRGYVRDVVFGKQTEEAVRAAQAEGKADERFTTIEGLILKQNITTLDSRLKILRPQLMALVLLRDEKPGNAALASQIADLAGEIENTEDELRCARRAIELRDRPSFGVC